MFLFRNKGQIGVKNARMQGNNEVLQRMKLYPDCSHLCLNRASYSPVRVGNRFVIAHEMSQRCLAYTCAEKHTHIITNNGVQHCILVI